MGGKVLVARPNSLTENIDTYRSGLLLTTGFRYFCFLVENAKTDFQLIYFDFWLRTNSPKILGGKSQ